MTCIGRNVTIAEKMHVLEPTALFIFIMIIHHTQSVDKITRKM